MSGHAHRPCRPGACCVYSYHTYAQSVVELADLYGFPPGNVYVRKCIPGTDHAGQEHVVCLPCWWKDKKQRCSNNISAVWARQQEAPNLSKPEIITSIATPSVNDYLVGYFIGFGAEFTTAADFSYRVSTGSVLQKVSLLFLLFYCRFFLSVGLCCM